MSRIEGIINSMTPDERTNPDLIDRSRRTRIAKGSGVDPAEVNKLLKDFTGMAGMMKEMAGMGLRGRMKAMQQMASGGMFAEGAQMQKTKVGTRQKPQDKDQILAEKLRLREEKKKKRMQVRKNRKRKR
jgi:signal recognition particle subunit SRP54